MTACHPHEGSALTPRRLLGKIQPVGATGFETFVHREYAESFASVPAIAVGSIAAFMLKDRLSGEAVPNAAVLGLLAHLAAAISWLARYGR